MILMQHYFLVFITYTITVNVNGIFLVHNLYFLALSAINISMLILSLRLHPLQCQGCIFLPFHLPCVPFLNSVWRKPRFVCHRISGFRCDREGTPPGSCHGSRQLLDEAIQGAENQASHYW